MAQPISGNAYSTVAASMHDGRKLGTVGLRAGQTCKAYFSAIPEDRWAAECNFDSNFVPFYAIFFLWPFL